MKCTDCKTNMVGYIPDHLRFSGRCSKCHKIFSAKLEKEQEEKKKTEANKKKEEVEKKKEETQDEKDISIFDLMDFE